MKQQQATAILAYGTLQTKKAQSLTKLPVIDITLAGWYEKLANSMKDNPAKKLYLCVGQAYILARKKIPLQTLIKIDKVEDVQVESLTSGLKVAAARIGDIAVSQKFHPVVKTSRAWLSSHHLELIKELFNNGFVIEILDEFNNPITTLSESEKE